MSDVKTARRLEALAKWANWANDQGFAVPSADVLADIATEPAGWRERVTSAPAHAWGPTIDYVFHQQKFGVNADEIVRSLPDEYARPSGPIEPSSPSEVQVGRGTLPTPPEAPRTAPPASDAPVVEALVAWRERRIADGADGVDSIKVTTLRNLVKFGYSDGETISKKLPGPAAYLGNEIASIISSFATPPAPEHSAAATSVAAEPARPAAPLAGAHRRDEPRPPSPPPPRAEAGLLDLTHDDFCEYRYLRTDAEEAVTVTPSGMRIVPTDDGLRLSYEPFFADAGKMVIYRVVAADGSPPRKPEAGDLVGVTTALRIDDRRALRAAVRAYQVWCHVGVDQEDAARNNPFLLARGQEVSPVSHFEIHLQEGRISGEWTAFPGAHRVRVYRIPMDGLARMDDPQHEICRGETNIDGFADLDAEPGLRYTYRACAEVSIDGATQLSRPVDVEVTVPVTLTPVSDLTISPSEVEPGRIDITWTAPPIGRVRVYWDSERPRADIGQQHDFTQSQLSIVPGFLEANRIKGPTDQLDGGRARIAAVAWPTTWPRVYLTPVTVLGEQVRVGGMRVETRPLPPVSNPEILERYDTEMVTFGWPREATFVLVYVGSTTMPPQEIVERNKPVDEIWQTRYERDGGVTFDKKLAAKGCTIVLVPVNYSEGQAVHGELTALSYPGLHRLRYSLAPERGNPTRFLTELHLSNDLDIDSAIALTMVNRPDRLPLSSTDGDPVYFVPRDGGEWTPQCLIPELKKGDHATGWRADWTRQRGFFRLFVSSQADPTKRYALADPPVGALYFDPSIPVPGAMP